MNYAFLPVDVVQIVPVTADQNVGAVFDILSYDSKYWLEVLWLSKLKN